MAYQRGVVSDTFELTRELHSFIANSVPGWQLWSNIDGYGDGTAAYDMVYRSLGSTGINDIYVRVRTAPVEPFLRGADYYDYSGTADGDTGYVVFQSYVCFPEGGDAYAGYSEIGKFGPRFLHMSGNTNYYVWHNEILSVNNKAGGGQMNTLGTSTSTPATGALHTKTEEFNHFTRQNLGPTGINGQLPHDTDGKNNVYTFSLSGNNMQRYDLRRGGGEYTLSTITRNKTYASAPFNDALYVCYYEDRSTKIPYIFAVGSVNTETSKLNLITEVWDSVSNIPAWPSRSGNTTSNQASGICWDGGDFIYMLRGGAPTPSFFETPDWCVYDIKNDSWRTTLSPDDSSFPVIPFNTSTSKNIEFYSKDISGFTYNRIYIWDTSAKEVYYLNLNINGLPAGGSPAWISQGKIGSGQSIDLQFKFLRSGRLFMMPQRILGPASSAWETFPNIYDKEFWYTRNIPDTGKIAWKAHDRSYFPQHGGTDGAMMNYFDGYMARVRTSLGASTEYIFIGDEDRIIVATKSRQAKVVTTGDAPEWNFCYAGAFDSHYSSEPYAELSEDVKSGYSKVIRLKNQIGEFSEHESYTIINTTSDMTYEDTHFLEGTKRKLSNSEKITITNTSGGTVTASLRNDYPAGSKIAIDPQPVGLMFHELEKFQTTSVANIMSDDTSGSYDPASQIYSISTESEVVDSTALGANSRGTGIPLWPMIISHSESEGASSSREIRGELKGMYSLGKFTTIDGGETITVGTSTYVVLDVPRYQTFVAIGPIND